jgi:hypothetical protein
VVDEASDDVGVEEEEVDVDVADALVAVASSLRNDLTSVKTENAWEMTSLSGSLV